MNILYCGSHAVLEHDEVKLFTEMGHSVFSLGGLYQEANIGNDLRGPIPGFIPPKITDNPQTKEDISPDLLKWADIIIMTHNVPSGKHLQPWIANNWEAIKKAGKPCVWRTFGQSTVAIEESLTVYRNDGLKIVRYCPLEKNIPSYIGEDAMIRFYIDPEEYKGYTGDVARIVNVSQAMYGSKTQTPRGGHMAKDVFEQAVNGLEWKIFGPDNEFANEHNGGKLSPDDLKSMLRLNRVFFYAGTRPASYTLGFIEAFMTGIPVVSVGRDIGNQIYNQKTFEVPDIIGPNGEAGFWSDDPAELHNFCKMLLENHDLAKQVGEAGRQRAIELFGKETIKLEWEAFFKTLV